MGCLKASPFVQALNQDRAANSFPSYGDASLWDQSNSLCDMSQQVSQFEASTSTLGTQATELYWQHDPEGSTNCWDDRYRVGTCYLGLYSKFDIIDCIPTNWEGLAAGN